MIEIDLDLMFYTQSTAKGHIRVKQTVFLPPVTILIHYLIHILPLKIWRNLGKMNLNEPGRQKLGTCSYGSPVNGEDLEKFGGNEVRRAEKAETRYM